MNRPPKVSLDDVGTRYYHYTDLLGLWNWAIEHLQSQEYVSTDDKRKLERLQAGAFLLTKQLDVLSGYEDARFTLRREINEVPLNPEHIPGGRGESRQ